MTEVFNYQGNSGVSGNSGIIAEVFDTELVEVVEQTKSRKRSVDINIVCPMAGRSFCLKDWEKSLCNLPLNRSHLLVYDNSNDARFSARLLKFCQNQISSFTFVRDNNLPIPAHLQHDCPTLSARCDAFYRHIYEELIDQKLPLCLNLEDDLIIPKDSFGKLYHVMQNQDVGTVIGHCNDRRDFVYSGVKNSISVDFQVEARIGAKEELQISTIHLPEKEMGVEAIGAGHMGLWLTRTDAIRKVGIGTRTYGGLNGTDMNWGYALNSHGIKFAIDWSIKMGHLFKDRNGKKQVC